YTTTNNALALVAACYDSKLAELLLPPPPAQRHAREGPLAQYLIHPRRSVEAVEKLSSPEALRERLQLMGYLATAEDQIPRLIHRTLGIWPIDAEDIDF